MEEDLALLQCPFTWDIPEVEDRDKFMKKLQNEEDQNYFLMNGFSVAILECFERYRGGEVEVAMRKIKECATQLEEYMPIGVHAKTDKYLWDRSSQGMWHVVYGTQAHLAFQNGDNDLAEEVMSKMKPLLVLDESNQAAILGIKCRIFMDYGPFKTTEIAIKCIRNALELDNTVPLWYFYLGKCLARYRRANAFYENPSQEEIEVLERAFSESNTPDKAAILLQSYADSLKKRKCSETEMKCRKLLNVILEISGDEWYIYWRCALTAMKLPPSLVKKSEMKSLIDMAIESSDRNRNTNTACLYSLQCTYYKRYEKNLPKALQFAWKAAKCGFVHNALDVIHIKYTLNKEEDLIPTIDEIINLNIDSEHQNRQILCVKANYLMHVKKQVKDAFDIYFKLMEEDCKDYDLAHVRTIFYEVKSTGYSVYDKLIKDLKWLLIKPTTSANDKILYRQYIEKLNYYKEKSKQPQK